MTWTAHSTYLTRKLNAYFRASAEPTNFYTILLKRDASVLNITSLLREFVALEVIPAGNNYSRKPYAPATTAVWDAAQLRAELPKVVQSYAATGGNIEFDTVALLSNCAASASTPATVASTTTLTVTAHAFTTGDPFIVTVDAGGSLPTGLVANTTYYATVSNANTITVYTDAGMTAQVTNLAGGSNFRVRYTKGNIELFDLDVGSVTIPDGGTHNFEIYVNEGGNGVNVNTL